ncbi:HET-domain-containing protein [Ophiobolus disseminans]|uniref:HET-domain-containing protein n=1 Tax=Ophiobolus disseminans TaxID=1469910 RepID=A0A6A7ADB3_9PLEO|nr:HET-domain-containing protein [Ophiobolus disseminans]
MQLLQYSESGKLSIHSFDDGDIPPYAILSHTWGADRDKYFWIDTCCINTTDKAEHSQAIQSMFCWYRSATKCYVYLSDVSTRKRKICSSSTELSWEPAFKSSRWFARGWTLQELLAPTVVEFFSQEGKILGNKTSLKLLIHKTTAIPLEVLDGTPLACFTIKQRLQ